MKCTKYRGVIYNRETKEIKGQTNMGSGEKFYNFQAGPTLMAIDLAMELEPSSINLFWALQDGYGEVGLTPPQGYDWSGIRDSSVNAEGKMFALAAKILKPYEGALFAKGLPASLVRDMTGQGPSLQPINN